MINQSLTLGRKYMVIPITASTGKRTVKRVITAGSATSLNVSFVAVLIITSPATEINPIAKGKIVAITIKLTAIRITCLTFVANI